MLWSKMHDSCVCKTSRISAAYAFKGRFLIQRIFAECPPCTQHSTVYSKKLPGWKADTRDRAKKFEDEELPRFLVATERNMVETLVFLVWEVRTGTQQLWLYGRENRNREGVLCGVFFLLLRNSERTVAIYQGSCKESNHRLCKVVVDVRWRETQKTSWNPAVTACGVWLIDVLLPPANCFPVLYELLFLRPLLK